MCTLTKFWHKNHKIQEKTTLVLQTQTQGKTIPPINNLGRLVVFLFTRRPVRAFRRDNITDYLPITIIRLDRYLNIEIEGRR